jgi:hypothetical protein
MCCYGPAVCLKIQFIAFMKLFLHCLHLLRVAPAAPLMSSMAVFMLGVLVTTTPAEGSY